MRFSDLLRMSSSSLWKRKVRTILTVLGVVIGVASIVVMVSLGLGLNKATMDQIESYGGLTTITVSEGSGSSYSSSTATFSSGSSSAEEAKRLDDALVESLSQIDHVELVAPVLSMQLIAKDGQYENTWMTVYGMTPEGLEKQGSGRAKDMVEWKPTGSPVRKIGRQKRWHPAKNICSLFWSSCPRWTESAAVQ